MVDGPVKSVFIVAGSKHMQSAMDGPALRCGISLAHFATITDCREALDEKPCHLLVVDLDGNAAGGLKLLGDAEPTLACTPKLALVDHGDIATTVRAIRAGAINCLEKPVENERFLAEIAMLLREADQGNHLLKPTLTPMEMTVLTLLLEGKTNCEAARVLHRSPRTIEVHRGHIMRKFGVSNMVDLMKTAASMGFLDT